MKNFCRSFALFLVPILAWQAYVFLCIYMQDNHLLSTDELIKKYGYPVEEHKVKTQDGHFLTIFRIPHGKDTPPKSNSSRPVILLKHGALACSSMFVVLGPRKSIAFQLADRGYDVWLGNSRGNEYGMEHETYSPSDPQFWDFYSDELGFYDLPATMDYILGLTKKDKLAFLGHSLGGAEPLILTSRKPEYNDKFSIILGVAPGVFINNTRTRSLEFMVKVVGPWSLKLGGNGAIISDFLKSVRAISPYCTPELFSWVFCDALYHSGGTSAHIRREDLASFVATTVASTSRKSVAHMAQCHDTGNFQRWIKDDGIIEEYRLDLVTAPVAVFYADEDLIVHPNNVVRLCNELPNCKLAYRVPLDYFNHVDFFYAENAPEYFYKEVFKVLEQYSDGENSNKNSQFGITSR